MPPTVAPGPKWGGLEGQALAFFGQHGLQLGQGRARARRDDQLAGLIAHDAGECTGIEHLAAQRKAMKVLGAPTPDAQGGLRGGGGADTVNQLAKGEFHGLHGSGTVPGYAGLGM